MIEIKGSDSDVDAKAVKGKEQRDVVCLCRVITVRKAGDSRRR